MKFLASLGAKADTPPGAGGAVRRATGLPNYRYGSPYVSAMRGRDVDSFVRDTYERVTWVYKATHAVAQNAARLKVIARKGDPDDGPETDHYMLDLLNFRASEYTGETAFSFRYRVSAQLELSTRGVFIEMFRNNGGEVMALHLLPPGTVAPIPDPVNFVSGYEVRIGSDVMTVPADHVLWIKNPHPIDPYRSMTPYEAAGLAIDTDWMAHVYNANFMRRDGRPAMLIAAKGGLEDDAADELAAWFMGGPNGAGATRVVEADGLDFVDMSTTPRDAQYVEMRNLSKEEVFIAAGVPETVAGNASGRTFDNADAEREVFWEEKMLGHLELIAGAYDLADNDPNTFIVHDVSKVPALQRSAQAQRAEWREEVDRGDRPLNEYREMTGEEPFDNPLADVPWVSAGQTPMFQPPGVAPPQRLTVLPGGAAPPAPAPPGSAPPEPAPPAEAAGPKA